MNRLGTILVFLIMFMSVVFMTIAMIVYSTHRNWREEVEGAKGWKVKYDTRVKEIGTLRAEKQALQEQLDAQNFATARVIAQSETKIDLITKRVNELTTEKLEADKQLSTMIATNQQQQQMLLTAQETEAKSRQALMAESAASDKRHKELIALTNELHALKTDLPVQIERNQQLAEQVAQSRMLASMLGANLDDKSLNPPPVDGTILATSKRDDPNLVELSMGKDDGLRINHRVDLYRGRDYLGYAVVTELDTSGNRAVAKVFDKKQAIRVGDNYTTRLQYLTKNGK
jgi:hypothetical protein